LCTSSGKEAPFWKRRDPGYGVFALLGGRAHCAAYRKAVAMTLENANARRRDPHRPGAEDFGGGLESQNTLQIYLQPQETASSKIQSWILDQIRLRFSSHGLHRRANADSV